MRLNNNDIVMPALHYASNTCILFVFRNISANLIIYLYFYVIIFLLI